MKGSNIKIIQTVVLYQISKKKIGKYFHVGINGYNLLQDNLVIFIKNLHVLTP